MNIHQRIKELYNEFRGLPQRIVRENQINDAFEILVLEVLFKNFHGIQNLKRENHDHLDLVTQTIVPPPDDSIDIFYEEKEIDESKFHIVQVRNQNLSPQEIEDCFTIMEKTMSNINKRNAEVRRNLREIVSNSGYNKELKQTCIYYVVHRGNNNYVRNQKPNHKVITSEELKAISLGSTQMCVPKENLKIDVANNFIYNEKDKREISKNLPISLICNMSGYDLAKLNNKYSNTLLGRNIIYGQNLRESLSKKSKTYDKMFETIDGEPDLFLYYNNGITIIAEQFDEKNGIICLENFSIINGAQTTSTLGSYLRNAELYDTPEKIESLKRVFVLTKIFQIDKSLPDFIEMKRKISIYSNTQTPLSSRDMVSIKSEQIELQKKFKECPSPNVFIEIKKGEEEPANPQLWKHQKIKNDILAQLALCAFFKEPYTAKDKKLSIFNNENNEDYNYNETYHKIFNHSKEDPKENGILFNLNNCELDELVFIYRLHEDTKNSLKTYHRVQIRELSQAKSRNEEEKKEQEALINLSRRSLDIINICLYYNVTCYYEIKDSFKHHIQDNSLIHFDYKKYYDNKLDYKANLIQEFNDIFYSKTLEIIDEKSGATNVQNWLRDKKSQSVFMNELKSYISTKGFRLKKQYVDFVSNYKIKQE